jgi:hypothetical protein
MKFILEEIETKERGINHWILQSDLTEKQYAQFQAESDSAYDYYERGDWDQASKKYSKLKLKYGIEAMDAYSFLSVMYANKEVKKEILDQGFNSIQGMLNECGYKPQDRIEYSFINHRPLFRLLYNVANFYISENIDKDKGFRIYELIYSNNPENDNQGIRHHLVWYYIEKGKLDLAFNLCKSFVNEEYHDDELAYAASLIALKRGNIETAKKYFIGAFKDMPLFGHLLLQHNREIEPFAAIAGENPFDGGVTVGSLNEALIIYKKSWHLWEEHLDVQKHQNHRFMIIKIVWERKALG